MDLATFVMRMGLALVARRPHGTGAAMASAHGRHSHERFSCDCRVGVHHDRLSRGRSGRRQPNRRSDCHRDRFPWSRSHLQGGWHCAWTQHRRYGVVLRCRRLAVWHRTVAIRRCDGNGRLVDQCPTPAACLQTPPGIKEVETNYHLELRVALRTKHRCARFVDAIDHNHVALTSLNSEEVEPGNRVRVSAAIKLPAAMTTAWSKSWLASRSSRA